MNEFEATPVRYHEDVDLFREAVNFTAAETGFTARLVEKDYFCSVLLEYLCAADSSLVFKGGTCLAKVHAGFYRLSEDLDFVIPTAVNSSRTERSNGAACIKDAVAELTRLRPSFQVTSPMSGANNSKHYIGAVSYDSVVTNQTESIKIEVSLREPLCCPPRQLPAASILLDPVSHELLVTPCTPTSIDILEAFAEKFRAALTRRNVAIRDFFDIDYAFRNGILDPADENLVEIVAAKLKIPGNGPVDVSPARFNALQRQLQSELKPVLRDADFDTFDLERAFDFVSLLSGRLKGSAA